jgi:hypothetical protein
MIVEVVNKEGKGRGYEIAKGKFVGIEPDEIKVTQENGAHTLDMEKFAPLDEINRRCFDCSPLPDRKGGEEAFAAADVQSIRRQYRKSGNGRRRCLINAQSSEPCRTSAPARHPAPKRANSCARKSTRSAAENKARRAGVGLRPPKRGKARQSTRRSAKYTYDAGQHKHKTHGRPRVSRAVLQVLKCEHCNTASRKALSRQATRASSRRTSAERLAAVHKAVSTKRRSAAAGKAARTWARRAA